MQPRYQMALIRGLSQQQHRAQHCSKTQTGAASPQLVWHTLNTLSTRVHKQTPTAQTHPFHTNISKREEASLPELAPTRKRTSNIQHEDQPLTSGDLYCRVWMSSVKCLCVQQALPKSTILHPMLSSRGSSSRRSACRRREGEGQEQIEQCTLGLAARCPTAKVAQGLRYYVSCAPHKNRPSLP